MIFAEGGEIIVQNFFLGDSRSSVIRVGEARFLSIDEFTAIADVQVADDIQTTAGQTSNLAASLAQSPGSGQNFQNTEIGDLDGGTDTLELLGTSNAGGGGSEPDGVAELADNIGATATADVTITVTGSNDAPVVDVEPSSETVQVAEDGMLAMSGVAVSDPDSPLVEVSLAVQHGTLALGLPLAGVIITAGANGSAAVTILGSAMDVTAALSGLSYLPGADFNGPDSLEIAVSDLGLPGTGAPLTDTAVIAIDVTPANDDPAAGDDTLSSVAEDSGTRIIGFADLLANDAAGPANESGQSLTIVGVSNAVGGVAVLNGTTIEFTPSADFNGEASFDYTIRDDGQTGGADDFRTDSARVSFDVTPVNDPAIVTGADTGSVTEDLTLTASGDLNHTDADNADDVWQAVAAGAASDGGYGTFSLTADGQWIYSLDNDDPAVQALKAGETLTDTFTVYTQDGTAKQVTVIVAGSNDAPVIEASSEVTGTVTESGVSAGTPVVTGLLTASDPDTGATQAWSGNAAGAYGAFVIDPAAGQWTYTLDEALADSLPESATVTETFTATVTDDLGATDTVDVTITVTGSNDAPTIEASSEVTGSVIESGVSAGTPVATGLLTATDPDTGASQSWSGDAAGSYGTFAVDAATGQWTYTLDEGLADSLAEGATVIETFTATVEDDFGATDTVDVTVTVTGSNDAPTIDVSSEVAGSVTESGVSAGTSVATGLLTASDPDAGATQSWSGDATGTFGTFAVNAATGLWTYTLDEGLANGLAEGQTVTETFSAIVTDDHGATDTVDVTVTVTGSNDAPMIEASSEATGSVIEGGVSVGSPVATGLLTASDPDAGATQAWSGDAAGAYGAFVIDPATGQWTYTLDEGLADSLAEGATATETFSVTVTDDLGATDTVDVTVRVTGSNDAPVIEASSEVTGTVTESGVSAGTPAATGLLTASDPDLGATQSWSGSGAGSYGTFTVDAVTGGWTYTLDAGLADSLAEGAPVTETFTATVEDDFGATDTVDVTITVTGSNDAPVIEVSSEVAGSVTESGVSAGTPAATGLLTASDPDAGATQAWSGNAAGSYGAFTVNAATGQWTYMLDEGLANGLAEGQTVTETFTATVTDDLGATDTVDVTVRVTGSNDAPLIDASSEVTGSVIESGVSAGSPVATGQLTATDPDAGATQAWSGSGAGSYGTFTVDAVTGRWTYSLNEGLADGLAEGVMVTETFTATVTDDLGATDTVDVTITVTGSNDAPAIDASSEVSGSVTESGIIAGNAVATGQLTASDPDTGATQSWSGDTTGSYGTFTVDPATGQWTYTLDEGLADSLAEDQLVTETFTATITDDRGATDTVAVTVTVTGSNDAPVVDVEPSSETVQVAEDGTLAMSGVAVSDPDSPLVEVSLAVQHGTLALGLPLAGVIITAGANGSAAVTILGSAMDVTAALSGLSYLPGADFNGPDSLEIAVSDLGLPGTGAPLTDTAVIAIDVTPANDDPAAGDDTLSSVAEDSGTRIIGFADLLANDAAGPANESGQSLTIVGVSNAVGGVAVLNGTTIEFTPSADFNGEASFDYTIRDDGQTGGADDFRTDSARVSFDVTPVNDPAIVTGADTGSVTEDLTLTASGDLNHTDADNADDVWQAVAAGAASDGGYGTFSLTADGQWIYSLDNDDPAVQALKAGETLTDTFTVYTQDGTGKQVTVTVHGADDVDEIAPTYFIGSAAGDRLSTAFDLTGLDFTKSLDPDIGNSETMPSVTVSAFGTPGEYEYYRIDIAEDGTRLVLDIDYAAASGISFDSYLYLLDGSGEIIDANDDAGAGMGGGGSVSDYDSYLSTTLDAGTYYIVVGRYHPRGGQRFNNNGTYELQVSLEAPGGDPIVLDLNGDGVDLSASAAFDIDADGTPDQIGWIGPEDGLLAMDLDGSGAIEDGSELFSEVFNGGSYADSLEALASLDDNNDGVIDARDTAFDRIVVWQDANTDGITQDGELFSISEHGIESVSLQAATVDIRTVDGNTVFAEGTYTSSDGGTGSYAGVAFGAQNDGEEVAEDTDDQPAELAAGTGPNLLLASVEDTGDVTPFAVKGNEDDEARVMTDGDDIVASAFGIGPLAGNCAGDACVLPFREKAGIVMDDAFDDDGSNIDLGTLLDGAFAPAANENGVILATRAVGGGKGGEIDLDGAGASHDGREGASMHDHASMGDTIRLVMDQDGGADPAVAAHVA